MDAPAAKTDRTLIVILSVIAALVVVALVVVFTRGTPEPIAESAPEGVVQRYSSAVIEGDEAAAMAYLVSGLADDCERVDASQAQDMRVTLLETTQRDDTADVRVLIVTSFEGGLLGPSEYEEEGVFDLVAAAGGGWLIESAPWPLTICSPVTVK